MNKLCRQYISEVKSFFPVLGKPEKEYISNLSRTIEEYCEDADITAKEDLYKKIGLPNEVSNTYIKNLDSAYIIKRIKCSNWIKRLSVSLILVAFILSMIYGIKTYHTHKVFEQEAISYSQTTITD